MKNIYICNKTKDNQQTSGKVHSEKREKTGAKTRVILQAIDI